MPIDTSNFNFQGIGVVNSLSILGCTDPTAFNYNPDATIEDGSCVDIVVGCMDPNADNNDSNANTPCENNCWGGQTGPNCCCEFSGAGAILGCTDNTASNYDPNANYDDGSCVPCIYGCMNVTANNYDASATCDYGCTFDIDCFGDVNGTAVLDSCGVCDGNDACVGCTNAAACNYDITATIDDGSCDLPNGCGDALYLEYDASVTCSDPNACLTPVVNGCMDCGSYWESINTGYYCDGVSAATSVGSLNYNFNANTDDGSCITVVYGCTDSNYSEFNSGANANDGSCLTYYGCTDPAASNYNPSATVDDGSCFQNCLQSNLQIADRVWNLHNHINAVDITVNSGEHYELTTLEVELLLQYPLNQATQQVLINTPVDVYYYEDAPNGGPYSPIGTDSVVMTNINYIGTTGANIIFGGQYGTTTTVFYRYKATLNVTPFLFTGQTSVNTTYWVGITQILPANYANVNPWVWAGAYSIVGGNYYAYYNINFQNTGWFEVPSTDFIYEFSGNCIPII